MSVQLINYYNSQAKDINGDCCDNAGSLWCFLKCDNWFKISFTTLPVNNWKESFYNVRTYVLGHDALTFPKYGQTIGKDLKNPIQFTVKGPFVSILLATLTVTGRNKEIFSDRTFLVTQGGPWWGPKGQEIFLDFKGARLPENSFPSVFL